MRLPLQPTIFECYFTGVGLECPGCRQPTDLWVAVLRETLEHFWFGNCLVLAGAQTTMFESTLNPNEIKELNLSAFGVPENAEILYLNLTSGGSAQPIVLHGNDVLRDPMLPNLHLFGRPIPGQPGDGPLSISVTWFSKKQDDTTIRHLVDAARQYQAERFEGVVVPANIAAEASITPVVELALARFASKENVRNFFQNAATYAHQLNVLLKVVADLSGAAPLPDHIRGVLNRLRGLRNDIAHDGTCRSQSRQEAAEHLTAAIFAVQYAEYLRGKCRPHGPDIHRFGESPNE